MKSKSKSIKINFEVLKTCLLKGFLLPCWLLRITSLPSTKFSSCVLCPWRLCFGGAGVREHDPGTSPRDWAKGKQSWCAVGSSSSWTKGFHEILWFCGVWLVFKGSLCFHDQPDFFCLSFGGGDIMMIGCGIVKMWHLLWIVKVNKEWCSGAGNQCSQDVKVLCSKTRGHYESPMSVGNWTFLPYPKSHEKTIFLGDGPPAS